MLNNTERKSTYVTTAGKITITAAVASITAFAFVFLFNAGKTEVLKVEAQSATTTLTILNTPPQWVQAAREEFESSTTTPTNSFSPVSWNAIASDTANQPYFLLICSNNATPTAYAATSTTGTRPPTCHPSAVQWGVSTSTVAGTLARVSTTTTQSGAFAPEIRDWYGYVCDDDFTNPRCNNISYQGSTSTAQFSSPFHVNFRPVLGDVTSNSPVDPGSILTFNSSSTDGNVVRGPDFIYLWVCNSAGFNATATNKCTGGTLASTTIQVTTNASATFALPAIVQDDVYDAYTYMVDQYNHPALGGAHGNNETFTVNNVAPTVPSGTISLNNGNDINLTVAGGQTTGFSLDFYTSDANSCINVASTSEVVRYNAAIYRSGVGSSTCSGLPGSYNANNCYPSTVATTTWNLSCTASTTSCSGNQDADVLWSCTFPLWFIADPTDAPSPYDLENWVATIAAIDDNNATGTRSTGAIPVELLSFPAIDLLTAEIPYGSLEPGFNNPTLAASTTILSIGNTGLNEELQGESMCPTFSVLNECVTDPSTTIDENNQQFGTSSLAYNSPAAKSLSSSTPQLLEVRVAKTTSTSTPSQGYTYWGIGVPISITTAGAYTGLNTFYAAISSSTHW